MPRKFEHFDFEELVLFFLLNSPEFRTVATPKLDPRMFSLEGLDVLFAKVAERHSAGDADISMSSVWMDAKPVLAKDKDVAKAIALTFDRMVEAADDLTKELSQDYMVKETEKWARRRALEGAVFEASKIIESDGDKSLLPDLFNRALSITMNDKLGLGYATSGDDRFEAYKHREDKIPSAIEKINFLTDGGFSRKSLNVWMAGTGIGKTAIMCSRAADYLRSGYNVLYITLEISEIQIAQRIDANILDVPIRELRSTPTDSLVSRWKSFLNNPKRPGELKIKEFASGYTTTAHIKALMKEYKQKHGFIPDVVFIDYLNLLMPTRRSGKDAAGWQTVQYAAEEVRGIGTEWNIVIETATQTTREGQDSTDLALRDTSESMGLPKTSDFYCAAYQTPEQREEGLLIFKVLKNRYSEFVNYKFALAMDYPKMRLSQLSNEDENNTRSLVQRPQPGEQSSPESPIRERKPYRRPMR
jgi:replicative DNA helicase